MMNTMRKKARMPNHQRQLARKVTAGLERLKFAIRDPNFPQEKLDQIEPMLKRAHTILVRRA